MAGLGERPLESEASQVTAAARWLQITRGIGPVAIVSVGQRSSLFSLVAAALEPGSIAGLESHNAMSSLKEVIGQDLSVDKFPELFCFGLLEEFDIPQLTALVRQRPMKN